MIHDPVLLDLAHSRLQFNAPLSAARADDLLARLELAQGQRALDLGCGDGALLLRLASKGIGGTGVDISKAAVGRAAARAAAHKHVDVRFVVADARQWDDAEDATICIGSSHIWGGAQAALRALAAVTPPGGRLLFGDGVWSASPGPAAVEIFGDLPDLPTLPELAVAEGWRPLYVGTSTVDEFDQWESDWRAGLELSGRPDAIALADERRREYLQTYRRVLGFAWLILLRPPTVQQQGATAAPA